MSQPTVSKRMRQLERQLGVTLLQRGPTGPRLTPADERMAALARRVLAEARAQPAASLRRPTWLMRPQKPTAAAFGLGYGSNHGSAPLDAKPRMGAAMSTADRPANSVFTWAAAPLKFGTGALAEIGSDARSLGIRRALLLTDAGVAATPVPERAAEALKSADVECEIFAEVAVEPTDASIALAQEAASRFGPDGLVALGGGSAIDTAKAVNLLLTQPGTLLDYVAKPIGGGRQPSLPLLPLIAVPTTSGTGSESTPICVIDVLELRLKAGISHPRLRPALAVVDPAVTATMPPQVTAASGMDVLTHALESYTALAYDARPAPDDPSSRPRSAGPIRSAMCGANARWRSSAKTCAKPCGTATTAPHGSRWPSPPL
jgi:hypothetical protein